MDQLTRYWITFDYPPADPSDGRTVGTWWRQPGFGVTAVDLDDALKLLRDEWFDEHGLDVPPIRQVTEDVDVSALDDHMRPNMNPPNWRGVWFPRTRSLR